jgi:hypothetical protein
MTATPTYVNNGTVTTASTSIVQDYTAYVTGGAAFTINNGISYTLETPRISGATFQIGSTTASNAANTTLVLNAGTVTGTGTSITFDNAHGTLVIGIDTLATIDIRSTDSASPTLIANPNLGSPLIGHFGGTIAKYVVGDVITIDTAVTASAALDPHFSGNVVDVYDIAGGSVNAYGSLTSGTVLGTLVFSTIGSATAFLGHLGTSFHDVVVTSLCFLPDTLIAVPDGETKVQDLRVGDLVRTASGGVRPVTWIGEGKVLAARGQRSAATPVIVRRGAFGDGVPHDVMLANGAPAESYRDDGNRWLFQNANEGWGLPSLEPVVPVVTGGAVVDAVWQNLLNRAGGRTTMPLTADPDLHLLVDGVRVDATRRDDDVFVFTLPGAPGDVRIVSRSACPQELGLARDSRELGVAIRHLAVRQGSLFEVRSARDGLEAPGFHPFEEDGQFRWTSGHAIVPADMFAGFAGPAELVLTVARTAQYIDDGQALKVA